VLSDYRVIDLSDERGLLCGHVLAQLGADVIHVEPPGGRPRDATWLAYTGGTRSVELDLDDPEGRARLVQLVAGADAVIESADPGTWERLGLGHDDLAAHNPALVWVSITPFGSHGPKAGYAATDLVVQAAAGTVDLAGAADRAPLRTAGITAWAHAGAEAAGGALIALHDATRTGRGQRVEVSAQRAKNLAAFFNLQTGRVGHKRLRRTGSGFTMCGVRFPFVWPCADGFVSLTLAFDPPNKPFLDRLIAYLHEEGGLDDDLAAVPWRTHVRAVRDGSLPNTDLQRLVDAIGEFLVTRTKADLLAAALDRRLLLVPVSTVGDLLDSPQLAERGFWQSRQLPDGRTVRVPGALARGAGDPAAATRPVPLAGAHTAEVLDEAAAAASRRAARTAATSVAGVTAQPGGAGGSSSTAPLAGLRVLDLMWVMAGPTSTGVLAQYGATVVRVENAARMDTVRLLPPYWGGKAGRERSLAYGSINAGKLSVTLDPNHPEARAVIEDLVRWADVVTESFSPRAMKGWGLDYDSLRRIKPDLIMLSSCLFGQDGPYALMAGYGTMGAAIGGMVQPTGWPDQPPAGPYGAYTDVCAPRISTALLLAAVEHRRRTGEGCYLDQSQIEASLHYLAPAVIDHQLTGAPWDRLGNDDPDLFPHGIFPAAGDDAWLAVAVRHDADWRALAGVIGRPEWADDPRFEGSDARRAHRTEIDAAIAAWTAAHTPSAGEAALQAHGVPAHAVLHGESEPDAQLEHLGHTVTVPHAGQDDRLIERTRVDLRRTPPAPGHVAALGEHTEYVLCDLLGYPAERPAALRACGALGGEPDRS
jgi:crotonobetainyl-CoA:carnitine CoA-transferase CaiB-like acyl-CoA transferase